MLTRPSRLRLFAFALALYAAGVTVALTTHVSSALAVTPLLLATATWAFGPRVGAPLFLATTGTGFAVMCALPAGSGPPPVAVLVTVTPVDVLIVGLVAALRRSSARRDEAERALQQKNAALEEALAEVKELRGMLPICAWCKCVRDVDGLWNQLEAYLAKRSHATLTHGICPTCLAAVSRDLAAAPVPGQPPAAANVRA